MLRVHSQSVSADRLIRLEGGAGAHGFSQLIKLGWRYTERKNKRLTGTRIQTGIYLDIAKLIRYSSQTY